MTNESNEEQDYYNVSERHYRIVEEGDRFFRRVVFGCVGVVIVVCAALFFFFWE